MQVVVDVETAEGRLAGAHGDEFDASQVGSEDVVGEDSAVVAVVRIWCQIQALVPGRPLVLVRPVGRHVYVAGSGKRFEETAGRGSRPENWVGGAH